MSTPRDTEAGTSVSATSPQDLHISAAAPPSAPAVDAIIDIENGAAEKSQTTELQPKLEQKEAGFANFWRILSFSTRTDRLLMAAGLVCSGGAGVALPLMNVVFGRLVGNFDTYFTPGASVSKDQFLATVSMNSLYIFILFLAKFALDYVSIFSFRMTGIRISASIRMAYLTALFAQPISVIDRLPPGMATDQLTSTANAIQIGISDKLAILVQSSALVISAFAVAFRYSWQLTLVSSSVILFMMVAFSILVPFYISGEKKLQASNGRASAVAGEVLKSVRTVKSLCAEGAVIEKYTKWVDEARTRGLSLSWISGCFVSLALSSVYADMGLTFWFGVKLYTQNDIPNVANVITVLFSVLLVVSAAGNIVAPIQGINKAASVSAACFEIIDSPQIKRDGHKDMENGASSDIRFENAKFAYPSRPETAVLQGLDLVFPAGKITAIVGPSGAGKSTIVGLLERWYQLSDVNEAMPTPEDEKLKDMTDFEKQIIKKAAQKAAKKAEKEKKKATKKGAPADEGVEPISEKSAEPLIQNAGAIFMGEYNIETLDLKWWRSQIGLVQQEPFLFDNTILGNVAMGLVGSDLEKVSPEEKERLVKQACQEAFADEFIRRLPKGYHTNVGESGIKLSGGQRQRLAIARSIIKRPTILILDEATSAIDVRGERIVQAALDQVSKGRTTITIAHRLSTIRKADQIVVLQDGLAVEQGTHDELITREEGVYSHLVHSQHLELGNEADEHDEDLDDGQLARTDIHLLERTKSHLSELGDDSTTAAGQASAMRGFFRSVGRILYEQRRRYIIFTLIAVGAAGAGAVFAVQSFLFSKFVTIFEETGAQLVSQANFYALMFFAMSLFVAVAWYTIGYCTNLLSTWTATLYRQEYFMSILGKPTAWFDEEDHSSGTLTSRLSNDPQQLQETLGLNMAMPLVSVFNLTGCTIVSFVFGWKLTLVVLFAALPIILTSAFFRMRYEMQFESFNNNVFAESSQFAAESIGAFRTVAALTYEHSILVNYKNLLDEHVAKAFKRGRVAVLVFALSDSIELACMALAFWYGGQLLASREYDVTSFLVVYIAIVQSGQAAGQFLGFGPNIARATAAANRILGFRGVPEVPFEAVATTQEVGWMTEDDKGVGIDFRDVGFTYPTRDVPVFRKLSLSIHPGSYVAFVGPSGCGKTTVISLLERFYDVSSGAIAVGGVELAATPLGPYRQNVALVSQEPTVFAGTVRENLTLGLPDTASVTDAQIEAAARAAEIHDFIISLPQGYGTALSGGTHVSLSGGQKQRLCIARALLRRPRLLLLDEATSSLDSASEQLVQRAIERVAGSGKVTIVVVAHRLATVQNADRIVVLGEGGRIVEEGRHAELVRKRGVYWGMCRAQALDR